MKILISKTLYQSIQPNKQSKEHAGFLCGVSYNEDFLVSGCLKNYYKSTQLECNQVIKNLERFLPGGINILGTFSGSQDDFINDDDLKFHVKHQSNDEGEVEVYALDASFEKQLELVITEDKVAAKSFTNQFISFTLNFTITALVDAESGNPKVFPKLPILKQDTAFYMAESKTILNSNCQDKNKLSRTVGEVFGCKNGIEAEVVEATQAKDVIAPYLRNSLVEKSYYSSSRMSLTPTCFISKNSTFKQLISAFHEVMTRQETVLSETEGLVSRIEAHKLATPRLYNFLLPGWSHPVVVCLPQNKSDEQLVEFRKNVLHQVFMQVERPTFRRSMALMSEGERGAGDNVGGDDVVYQLVCPHVGLDETRFKGCEIAYVKGEYTYHHYKQDGVDDTGWGCAYRSLQTIVSWAKYHGYCSKPVPTLKRIQEVLVRMGDKPKRFIGSNSWIGSIEVQRVLEDYAGMSSKIVNLSSGPDIAERARQILMHFRTEGTPIMIGGGVLAHTIIGVAFNTMTGNSQFVVLDPHYPGKEDLKIVQSKGWCNWKKPNFWDSNTFYNLCLPLSGSLV